MSAGLPFFWRAWPSARTSSMSWPMPTGLEIASEISFVRSICSRIESIVESTRSMFLWEMEEV